MKIRILIRMGALIGIGLLINKNTLEGGAHSKGVLILRRVLNRIIIVTGNISLVKCDRYEPKTFKK